MKTAAILFAAAIFLVRASWAGEVRLAGSDSMVLLAQGWAEVAAKEKRVFVSVQGGGSGAGIAALIHGSCEIAMSTREIKDSEIAKVRQARGAEPIGLVVCFDALVIIVHKANPQKAISIPELRDAYIESGTLTDWEQLRGGFKGRIEPFGRDINSGEAAYFGDAIFGKPGVTQRAFKVRSSDEMVNSVAGIAEGLGYVPFGRAKAEGVRVLAVSKEKGGEPVELTEANVRTGTYPLGRKLYFYTAGELSEDANNFLKFVTSPAGQKLASEGGFLPLKK